MVCLPSLGWFSHWLISSPRYQIIFYSECIHRKYLCENCYCPGMWLKPSSCSLTLSDLLLLGNCLL